MFRYHSGRLQLTASRSTRYEFVSRIQETSPSSGTSAVNEYVPRVVSPLAALSMSWPAYGEFDIAAMVVHVSSSSCPPRGAEEDSEGTLNVVFMADTTGILEVRLYGGVRVSHSEEGLF